MSHLAKSMQSIIRINWLRIRTIAAFSSKAQTGVWAHAGREK